METTILNNNSDTKYIAFFDLDRTLIRTNSGRTIIKEAYSHKLLSRSEILKAYSLSLLFRLKLLKPTRVISSMLSWIKGISLEKMTDLSNEIFKDKLISTLYSEVNEEIRFHKQLGAKVVILSSAILPVCKIIADHLMMDDIICTELETESGFYTGKPLGKFCFGNEKPVRLMQFCLEFSVNPSDSWYYGDSISDFPALCEVGFPVCINPDRKLKKEAISRGWKILAWH